MLASRVPTSAPAKPIAAKAAAKPTVPRASTTEKSQQKQKPVAPAPPPVPATTNEVVKPEAPPSPPPASVPPVGASEVDADDDASLRRLSASPIARTAEVLVALTLFVAYLCRALVEGLVGACRPLWARASRDAAAARVYRR